MLVDGEGHLILNDFGFSSELKSDKSSAADWMCFNGICDGIFIEPNDENQTNFMKLYSYFEKMTDSKLSGKYNNSNHGHSK